MADLGQLLEARRRPDLPEFGPGDTLRVHVKVVVTPDGLVRGHRFWTAVKVRGRLLSAVLAFVGLRCDGPRAGSYVVPCIHIA